LEQPQLELHRVQFRSERRYPTRELGWIGLHVSTRGAVWRPHTCVQVNVLLHHAPYMHRVYKIVISHLSQSITMVGCGGGRTAPPRQTAKLTHVACIAETTGDHCMCNVEHQTLVDTVLEIIPLRRYKFTKNAIRLGGPVSDSATPCQMPNASRAVCGPSASWRPAAEYHHRRARTCVRQHAQQQSSSSSQRIIRTVDQPSAGVLPTPLSSARQPCKRAAALHVYNSSRAATVFCVSMS
jgi:hypothetical protein